MGTTSLAKEAREMKVDNWTILIRSLFEHSNEAISILPGQDLNEWLGLVQSDYSDEDRELIEVETTEEGRSAIKIPDGI